MAKLTLQRGDVTKQLGRMAEGELRRLLGRIGALQLSQVERAFREGGQPSKKWPPFRPNPKSFRAGGQALQDTGRLAASFFLFESRVSRKELISTIASSAPYASAQQEGFKTKGPNYIPLTLKGRRMHRTGANPRQEGLVPGKDYVMAWKGVTVPARPMIDYADPINLREINSLIGG